MQIITKFKANDGSEHATEEAAIKRDSLVFRVNGAMNPLGATPMFVRQGKGWLQHDPEIVLLCRDAIVEICRTEGLDKHYPVLKNAGREIHFMSIAGRILDDFGGPLAKAWARLCCIDEKGCEHQQPYFALNGPAPEQNLIETRI